MATDGKPSRKAGTGPPNPLELGRRLVGLLLIALVAAPVFLILDPGDFTQNLMRTTGRRHWGLTWGGAALAVIAGIGLAFVTRGRVRRAFAALGRASERPSRLVWAVAVGLLGAGLTVMVAHALFDARTILNDASVQLVQARYFAAGRLSGPVLAHPEFWAIQFMVLTAEGWVSQYPPMHALVVAAGFTVGAAWIAMGGVVFALCAATSASLERLLPDRVAVARGAALATAISPLLLGLAAGYMNHATVGAFVAIALYCALRAEESSAWWALAAGAAVGAAVCTRPVTGLVIGIVVTLGIWLTAPDRPRSGSAAPGSAPKGADSGPEIPGPESRTRGWLLPRIGAWVAGGIPFAVGFGWFNARFFGSPTTLGYVAASGPSHGLGFHEDPWGRYYGFTEALGNTSAELVALGRELLGTPFPIVAVVGYFLLTRARLSRGERILALWALLPVLASALYWHHDLVFGPRMLGEAVPAWCALLVIAAVALVRRAGDGRPSEAVALTAALALVAGLAWGGWSQIDRHANRLGPYPEVEREGPSLVFVHEPWSDRLGARLTARGMRLDSVRTLLTRYHPCQLEAAFRGQAVEQVTHICRREQEADVRGGFGITGILWLDDLPGIEGDGPMWVRDLGPERNALLIEEYPEREPLFLLPEGPGTVGRVVTYEEGVSALWDRAASPSGSGPGS